MTPERLQELQEKMENKTITPEEEVELLKAINETLEALQEIIKEIPDQE